MILTTRQTLENGLTLLLVETHQAPVVSLNICLRVGSRYEEDQEAGMCHLIEHMLFKGTRQLGPGDLAKLIEGHGGDVNAYTSFDETVYYCTLSSRQFERALELMSDAVLNSVIDPKELGLEREVVIEEILRGKDSPTRVLSETLFEKAFSTHNYGRPIIGFDKTVRAFTREQVYDFYRRWYQPQNMVVAAAGNFQTSQILKLCEKIFGALPASPPLQEKIKTEPPQTEARAFSLGRPVQGSHMMLGYHIPKLDHPDIPALDILSHILGEGESSRLDIQVKEKKGYVNSVYSYVYTPEQPGLFTVGYSLPEKNIEKASRQVFEVIHQIQNEKVQHDEMARAKINIKSDAIYEKETVEGLARKYGYFETILRRYDFDEEYYRQIDNVTRDHVYEIAQKYLHPKNLTLGLVGPQDAKKKWQPAQMMEWYRPRPIKKITRKIPQDVHYLRLKNGLRLILRENPSVPTLVIRTAQLGGLRTETPTTNGIHSLLAQVWGKSTVDLAAADLARQVEQIAGSIEAYNGRNVVGMKADFLSEKTREGVELFLNAYLNPRFDKMEISREKANILEAIRREEDSLSTLVFKLFLKELYPKHPYGMPILGNQHTLRRFQRNELRQTFRRAMDPKQTVISIVGDFEHGAMIDYLGPRLETLRVQRGPRNEPKADPQPKASKRVEKFLDKLQAHIVYGFRGLRFKDPDRYALDVLNNILAGQGGRLFLELRDKMSLAYTVTSLSQEGIEPGYFGVYIATEAKKVATAIAGIERELKKLLHQGVREEEMERAKRYMVGAYDIELQRNAYVATQLAFNEIYGMDRNEWIELPKKILKVTRQEVMQAAEKIIRLDQHILAVVLPPL